MMKLKELTSYLEGLAPLSTQESYDNSGLIVGDPNSTIDKVLIALDCTEEIIEEAVELGAKLVIAHHPIVFKGLKSLTGKNYVERTVIKAIKNDIAIYAIHTNLDNYLKGVNDEICKRIGLVQTRVLAPMKGELMKLVVYVPSGHLPAVQEAAFSAGAGNIGNYSECSFSTEGVGTFKPGIGTSPFLGNQGERSEESEHRVEFILERARMNSILNAVRSAHPYEEMAYEFVPIENIHQDMGAGMIGQLEEAEEIMTFLNRIKEVFGAGAVRYTNPVKDKIQKVAVCGGSGSFLLKDAMAAGADVFITGDFTYHEFFDAEERIVIADIGHYESEQFTSNRLKALIQEKFPTFAVHLTRKNTNPINYL